MKNMKELVDNQKAAAKAAKEGEEAIGRLTEKQTALQGRFPALQEATKRTEVEKQKALDLFVSEKISETELDKAREAFDKAFKEEGAAAEMLDALNRALRKAESDLPKLHNDLNGADRQLWRAVLEDIKAEIREAVGAKIERAYAAAMVCGSGHSADFVPTLFEPIPLERARVVLAEMKREIIG